MTWICGLTHIIRGADHISNTPKQVLQYLALGKPLPVFAHLPLILGPDKSRLSKRHGATSVLSYQDMGIVPEAFRNFLALLGWTPGSAQKDREIFSSDELIDLFSLDGISRSNAVFDNDKLAWFNTEWIRRYSPAELLPLIEAEWAKSGFRSDRTREEILAAIALLQPRARSLKDFAGAFRGYFSDAYEYDTAAVAKFLSDERSRGLADGVGRPLRRAGRVYRAGGGAVAARLCRGEKRQGRRPDQWIAGRADRAGRSPEPLRGDGRIGQGAGGKEAKSGWRDPLSAGRIASNWSVNSGRGTSASKPYWATTVTETGMVCGGMQEFASQAW